MLRGSFSKLAVHLENYDTPSGRCAHFTENTLNFMSKGCLEAAEEWVRVNKNL
jgi:hypothetical protein